MKIELSAGNLNEHKHAHDYLRRKLQLPEYYGENMDALYECASELPPTDIFIYTEGKTSSLFRKIVKALETAARDNESLTVTVLPADGRSSGEMEYEIPEEDGWERPEQAGEGSGILEAGSEATGAGSGATGTGSGVTGAGSGATGAGSGVTGAGSEVIERGSEVMERRSEMTEGGTGVTEGGTDVTEGGYDVTERGYEVPEAGFEVKDDDISG